MYEYIERKEIRMAYEKLIRSYVNGNSYIADWRFDEMIEKLPAADVAIVRHGRWETNSDRPDSLICSVCKCGFDMWKHDPHNYCPNCGAKMQEGVE